MKTIAITCLLLLLATAMSAVTITLSSGVVYKGDILSVSNDQYRIKTASSIVVVFKQEIVKAVSDAGYDVTDTVLNMEQTARTPELTVNRVYLANGSAIAAPLWIMALTCLGAAAYLIFSEK